MPDQVIVLGLAVAFVVALHLFLKFTRIGLSMRSTAENPALLQVCSIAHYQSGALDLDAERRACHHYYRPCLARRENPFENSLPMLLALFTAAAAACSTRSWAGLIVCHVESLTALSIPTGCKASVPFSLLLITFYLRPQCLFSKSVHV